MEPQTVNNDKFLHIRGLGEIADQYDCFVLDLFGVIHNGISLYDATLSTFESLNKLGKKICLVSNTPKRAYRAKQDLATMGITPDMYTDLISAGEAAHLAILNRVDAFHQECGDKCWFLGTEPMAHILDDLNVTRVENIEDATFIINSVPGTSRDEPNPLKAVLEKAISLNLPMVCANPDLVVNIGDDQYVCAGTYAKYYEDMGGKVSYHGKPYAEVYNMAWEAFGKPDKSRVVAVGDSLHTDIQGANNFGIDGIFNLTGIHWDEVTFDHRPGFADMDKVTLVIENQPYIPSMVMSGLKW